MTDIKEKSLARILHDVSGFKEVFICARVHSLSLAGLGFVFVYFAKAGRHYDPLLEIRL